MRVSAFLACAFALFANALPQDADVTPSSTTEASTATGTPAADVEACFYLSSKDQGKDAWLHVGLTSSGFRSVISDDKTPFNLTDGKLFTRNNRVSMGYTRDSHSWSPYPEGVDFLYFTSVFTRDNLDCRIESDQLRCDSVTLENRTRSDLVYCSWKHGNTTPRIFGFITGDDVPTDCNAATLGVVACDAST